MKVRATQVGFIGNKLRNEGDEFTLVSIKYGAGGKKTLTPQEQFSDTWMEKVRNTSQKASETLNTTSV